MQLGQLDDRITLYVSSVCLRAWSVSVVFSQGFSHGDLERAVNLFHCLQSGITVSRSSS